jgi:MYXO-CTERM domain-containing protein
LRFATRFVVSAAVLTAALSPERDAHAFCRTATCDKKDAPKFIPTESLCQDPEIVKWCAANGKTNYPVWWKTSCVGYSVQRDASPKYHLSLDQVNAAVDRAFHTWTSQTCSDGRPVSINAINLGPVECTLAGVEDGGYYADRPNQHVIVFRDDVWPHANSYETIALTSVNFDTNTGELYDADMEINSADHPFVDGGDPPRGVYDLEAILTHEAGHFLGLSHSPEQSAIMYYSNEGGSSLRHPLSNDDIAGICTIYPPDGTRSVDEAVDKSGHVKAGSCDPEPRHGFSSKCAPPPSPEEGCGVGAPGSSAAGGVMWLGAFVGIGALARRRRRIAR